MLKFTVDAAKLLDVVKRADRFIPTRTVEDKFYCLRIDVSEYDLTVSCQRPGESRFMEILKDEIGNLADCGYFLIRSAKLLNVLQPLSGAVIFRVSGNDIQIKCGGATFNLTQHQEGYEPFPDRQECFGAFSPDTTRLVRSIRLAAECAGYRDQLAAIRGVNFKIDVDDTGGHVQIFGTDKVRIALSEFTVHGSYLDGTKWHRAIYHTAAFAVADLLDPGYACMVSMLSSGPMFQQRNWRVICQGIPTFTNDVVAMLERGMPLKDAVIPADGLASLLRQANLAAEEQAVAIFLSPGDVAVFSQKADGSFTTKASMVCEHGGSPRDLWLNGRLLLSMCELASGLNVVWQGTEPTGTQIFCLGDETMRFGIMPMNPATLPVKEDANACPVANP